MKYSEAVKETRLGNQPFRTRPLVKVFNLGTRMTKDRKYFVGTEEEWEAIYPTLPINPVLSGNPPQSEANSQQANSQKPKAL